MNQEKIFILYLNKYSIYSSPNIIWVIKSGRMKHTEHMGTKSHAKPHRDKSEDGRIISK
jgi:hypothetical protein